ncbi:MAG: hypothetical protein HRK26_01050 [Rickettsiaceae bacterium H1]|nr:hypothetical protein [Rickettsiaceae bacterium H1]
MAKPEELIQVQSEKVNFTKNLTADYQHQGRVKGEKFQFNGEVELKVIEGKNAAENKQNAALVLDFDDTIVNGHMHNAFARLGKIDNNITNTNVENFIKNGKGFRNEKSLQEKINTALEQDIPVAVASHSSYPRGIKIAMQQLLGEEGADKITVVTCNNQNMQGCRVKEPLLDKIKEIYSIESKENMVLVDDNAKNIKHIKEAGYKGVTAPRDTKEYLNEIDKFIENHANKNQQEVTEAIYENVNPIRKQAEKTEWQPKKPTVAPKPTSATNSNQENKPEKKVVRFAESIEKIEKPVFSQEEVKKETLFQQIKSFFITIGEILGFVSKKEKGIETSIGAEASKNTNDQTKGQTAQQNAAAQEQAQKTGPVHAKVKETTQLNLNNEVFKDLQLGKSKNFTNGLKSLIKQNIINEAKKINTQVSFEGRSLEATLNPPITKKQKEDLVKTAKEDVQTLLKYNNSLEYKLGENNEQKEKIKTELSSALENIKSQVKHDIKIEDAIRNVARQKIDEDRSMMSVTEAQSNLQSNAAKFGAEMKTNSQFSFSEHTYGNVPPQSTPTNHKESGVRSAVSRGG